MILTFRPPHLTDKMMSDRKYLILVLLPFFSLMRLHACSALLRAA